MTIHYSIEIFRKKSYTITEEKLRQPESLTEKRL